MRKTGILALVVGPSGAGKDTLIRAAKRHFQDDPDIVFPRRVITRPSSQDEENVAADVETFERLRLAGAFSLAWSAHGLAYGVPVEIEAAITAGKIIVVNVSRQILAEARERFARVSIIEITANEDVLTQRLARRKRATDGDLDKRLARRDAFAGIVAADLRIFNDGSPEPAIARFVAWIRELAQTPAAP